jgi:hypothetical protein
MRKLNNDITFDDMLEEELGQIGMASAARSLLAAGGTLPGRTTSVKAEFLKFPKPKDFNKEFVQNMTRGVDTAVVKGLEGATDWIHKVHKRLQTNKVPYAGTKYLYIMNQAIKKAYKRLHTKYKDTAKINPWLIEMNTMLIDTVPKRRRAEAAKREEKKAAKKKAAKKKKAKKSKAKKPEVTVEFTPTAAKVVKQQAKEKGPTARDIALKKSGPSHKDIIKILKSIDAKLLQDALQKQATHEHSVISGTDSFRDTVMNRLRNILNRLTPGSDAYIRLSNTLRRVYGIHL